MKLTLAGAFHWMSDDNKDLFEFMTIPIDINRDDLIDTILLRYGEFELIYPDADFLKLAIGTWSRKNLRTFDKWIYGLAQEFNPIHNYDRFEESSDDENTHESTHASASDQASGSSAGASNTTDKISAFNSDVMQPDTSSSGSSSSNNNSTSSTQSSGENSSSRHNAHKAHLYGNIGVTTSAAMLKEYLDVEKFNIYDQIADLFAIEFCIPVY